MQKTTANFGKTQHAAAGSSAPPLMQSPSRLTGLCVAALVSATISAPSWGQIDPDFPGPTETVEECCDGYVISSYDEGFNPQLITSEIGSLTTPTHHGDETPCAVWWFIAVGAGADITSRAYLFDDFENSFHACNGEITPLDKLRKSGTSRKTIRWNLPCQPQPARFRFHAKALLVTTGRIDANNGWPSSGCGGLWTMAATEFQFDSVIDPARNTLGTNPWPGVRGGMSVTAGQACEGAVDVSAFVTSRGAGLSGSWTWDGDVANCPMNVVVLPSDQPFPWADWEICAAFNSAKVRVISSVEFILSAAGATMVNGTAAVSTVDLGDRPVRIRIEQTCSDCANPSLPNPGSTGGNP